MTPHEAREFKSSFLSRCPTLLPILEVLDAIPGAFLFVKDRQSRYVNANDAALSTYGLHREEELIGRRSGDFFPSLLADAWEAEDHRVMESGVPITGQTWLVPHIRGTPRWFASSKAPVLNGNGETMGLLGVMHPITTPADQRVYFQELQRVMEYIDQHYLDEIDVGSLAEIAGYSVPHFSRRFRQLLRLAPMEYVNSLRIQEAQRLLATTDETIADIALTTGHYDQSHFTRRFRHATGMTPLAWRKRYRPR